MQPAVNFKFIRCITIIGREKVKTFAVSQIVKLKLYEFTKNLSRETFHLFPPLMQSAGGVERAADSPAF